MEFVSQTCCQFISTDIIIMVCIIVYMQTITLLFIDLTGHSSFDWFEVGRITRTEFNSFQLMYVNDENISTVWPG